MRREKIDDQQTPSERSVSENREGQAVIEFVLMIAVVLSIFVALRFGFQNIRNFLWMEMSCQVVAPCPGCAVSDEFNAKAQARAPGSCRRNRP